MHLNVQQYKSVKAIVRMNLKMHNVSVKYLATRQRYVVHQPVMMSLLQTDLFCVLSDHTTLIPSDTFVNSVCLRHQNNVKTNKYR